MRAYALGRDDHDEYTRERERGGREIAPDDSFGRLVSSLSSSKSPATGRSVQFVPYRVCAVAKRPLRFNRSKRENSQRYDRSIRILLDGFADNAVDVRASKCLELIDPKSANIHERFEVLFQTKRKNIAYFLLLLSLI